MNIAFLTPYNAICGVSEVSRNLVNELAQRHDIGLLTNYFAGEYYEIPTNLQTFYPGPNNYVRWATIFDTGFQQDQQKVLPTKLDIAYEFLKQADCLLVNYQDYIFRDKKGLNLILEEAKRLGKRTFIMLNDSCLSVELNWNAIDYFIVPPGLQGVSPKTKTIVVDQGIPELENLNKVFMNKEEKYWELAVFGLGRNKTEQLIDVVKSINDQMLLKKILKLNIYQAKPNQFQDYEEEDVIVHKGYLPSQELGQQLHWKDAVVIWYPDIQARSTSSAFRFAIGAQVPIISNLTNWIADWEGSGVWMDCGADNPAAYKEAIVKLFNEGTYDLTRERMERLQVNAIKEKGWSTIAGLYDIFLYPGRNPMTLHDN